MEHLPHLVIEGVILSAYAIGASKAYLYINANYETAIKSITDALAEAKAAGYWGANHFREQFQPRHRNHPRSSQLCRRRRYRGYRSDRRQKTLAAPEASVSRYGRALRQTDVGQQRGDSCQRAADHFAWRRVVPKIWYSRKFRHDDLFAE